MSLGELWAKQDELMAEFGFGSPPPLEDDVSRYFRLTAQPPRPASPAPPAPPEPPPPPSPQSAPEPLESSRLLQAALHKAGLRQIDLVHALDLDASIISLWVRGKRRVPRSRAARLAQLLGVTEAALGVAPEVEASVSAVRELAEFFAMPPQPARPRVWPERWTFDMDKVPPPPTPKPRSDFAQWRAQSALEHAGMVPTPQARRRWECYCLWCGRGVGRDAVLVTTDHPERPRPDCQTCGGPLLVREVETAEDRATDSLMRERWAA